MSPSLLEAGSYLLDEDKPMLEERFGNSTMCLIVFVVFWSMGAKSLMSHTHVSCSSKTELE